ncbi:transglycosylase SLT domain-containing protein [Streptomyces tubercidicus]|uniref:transglycosylase SLT domain-containing protein n=1 Tax=Streptomyces tubercidicus TaxID=47759 RepID=UPI002E13DC1E|nr:transglycosylase SLT domain-containing protein [Streptomyces tubercidicus]WSX24372.1 transglycosylase SLT domain-containing protein [Streptomyces tubercidicus]
MPSFTLPRAARITRITRTHKVAVAVLAAAGATSGLAFTSAPDTAQAASEHAPAAVKPVNAQGQPGKADGAKTGRPVTASVADHVKVTAVEKQHSAQQAANRSAERKAVKDYPNNLDGWIRESLDIMKAKGIPGSYEGLHRNIMRESAGDPNAVNDWDINAINGVPSKGLLQVIQPTFDAYHVSGTPHKLTDPIANITAAANYAADRYGSIDNVNSAY